MKREQSYGGTEEEISMVTTTGSPGQYTSLSERSFRPGKTSLFADFSTLSAAEAAPLPKMENLDPNIGLCFWCHFSSSFTSSSGVSECIHENAKPAIEIENEYEFDRNQNEKSLKQIVGVLRNWNWEQILKMGESLMRSVEKCDVICDGILEVSSSLLFLFFFVFFFPGFVADWSQGLFNTPPNYRLRYGHCLCNLNFSVLWIFNCPVFLLSDQDR